MLRPKKKMQIGGDYEEDNKFNSTPAHLRPQPSYGFVGPMQPATPNYGPMGPFNYDNSPGLIDDCTESGMVWSEEDQRCVYPNGYDPAQHEEKNKPKGRGVEGMLPMKTGPGTGVNPQDPTPVKKEKLDPYFSLRGATTGLSWLAGVVARNRQNQYARDEFSTLGQIGAKNVNDFQPNRYNLYAQKGGPTPIVPLNQDYMNDRYKDYTNFYSKFNIPPREYSNDDGFDAYYHHTVDNLPKIKTKVSGWNIVQPGLSYFEESTDKNNLPRISKKAKATWTDNHEDEYDNPNKTLNYNIADSLLSYYNSVKNPLHGFSKFYQQGGKLPPITVDNPNDPRLRAYNDSLNLYKAMQMQDKLMGPKSSISTTKVYPTEWTTKELKDRRNPKKVSGLDMPVAQDFKSEKDQFLDGFNLLWARKQDKQLLDYYKSLGFGQDRIQYHSSPDIVSDKIRPIGNYFDGTAESPIYKKPVQPVVYKKPEPKMYDLNGAPDDILKAYSDWKTGKGNVDEQVKLFRKYKVPETKYKGSPNFSFLEPFEQKDYPIVERPGAQVKGTITPGQMTRDTTQDGVPIYGPANSTIGYYNNGQFSPYTGANQRGTVNDADTELMKDPEKLKKYLMGKGLSMKKGGILPKAQQGKLFPDFTSSYDFGPVKPDPQLKSASKKPVKVQVNQGQPQTLSNLQMLSRMALDTDYGDTDPNFEKLNEMQKTYWTSRHEYGANEYKNNNVGKSNNFIKLTSGRFNGANVPSALLDSAIATSKRKNIPFGKLATLMGRESTFGAGENMMSQLRSGSLKDVISGWNVDESYRPYSYVRFLADNKVPGVMGMKSKHGLDFYIDNKDKVEDYLRNNPKIIESYNKKLTSQPKLNNQNALDLAVDFINKKGISGYNPGDSDYTNKFNKDYNLLANDKALRKYLLDRGVNFKKGGLTPNKAREILHDKKVHGKPLTDKQRRLFGAISEGHTLKY